MFEAFYTGEINIGPITVKREFIKCKDRLADKSGMEEAFTYFTTVVDSRRQESESLCENDY